MEKDFITSEKLLLRNNKAQLLTKAKIMQAESANLKGVASNKLYRSLTVKCSEMPASF